MPSTYSATHPLEKSAQVNKSQHRQTSAQANVSTGKPLFEGESMSHLFQRAWMAIAVQSLTGSVQFYQTLLGDGAVFRQIGGYVEFDLGDLRLGLFEPKPEASPEFAQRGQNPISLCLAVTDLDRSLAAFCERRAAALASQSADNSADDLPSNPAPTIYQASHGRETYLYDPDGNRIILYEARSQ
jgi:predicted enzyme related to lactoylglutathione lyase